MASHAIILCGDCLMTWFRNDAPIRLKMLVSYGTFVALLGATTLATVLLPPSVALWVGLAATGVGGVLAHLFREAVCVPYVATVVRMEGLAAGDLDTPIAFTEYRDCVGRMTKAMFAFRATAQEQIALNAESHRNS